METSDERLAALVKSADDEDPVAQRELATLYAAGAGSPFKQDFAKARELYAASAAQGDAEAKECLIVMDEAAEIRARKAAERGDVSAQTTLGLMLALGDATLSDTKAKEGLEWLKKAADQGDMGAQEALGTLYAAGKGVDRDTATAVGWFAKAAAQGSLISQRRMGVAFFDGKGVDEDKNKGLAFMTKAAEGGDAFSQMMLGEIFSTGGGGMPVDPKKGVEWSTKAAEQGNARAQYSVAMCHIEGKGVAQDKATGVEWLLKGAVRRPDDAPEDERPHNKIGTTESQFALGSMYIKGDGVAQDREKALEYMARAAEQGHANAQFVVQTIAARGQGGAGAGGGDGKTREQRMLAVLMQAAEAGDAQAQGDLAHAYFTGGNGLPKDKLKAAEWFEKAAASGDLHAAHFLANMYLDGDGVPRDRDRGRRWMLKAAEQGNIGAQRKLGMMFLGGDKAAGVEKDVHKGIEWLTHVGEQGDMMVQRYLASVFHKGDVGNGVRVPQLKDEAKAAEWSTKAVASFSQAAESGDVEAQYALGRMYCLGDGAIAADTQKGIQWLSRAAAQGHAQASKAMSRFSSAAGSAPAMPAPVTAGGAPSSASSASSASAPPPPPFPSVGCRVELHSMKAEDYNGLLGYVVSEPRANGRWGVCIDDRPKKPVAIRAANLRAPR